MSARELFKAHPEIKKILWTGGYYATIVGQYGNKDVIRKYIEKQGKEEEYKKITANNSSYGINQYLEACLGVVY